MEGIQVGEIVINYVVMACLEGEETLETVDSDLRNGDTVTMSEDASDNLKVSDWCEGAGDILKSEIVQILDESTDNNKVTNQITLNLICQFRLI